MSSSSNPAEPRTIGAWIGHKAEANGDRLALTVEGRDKSYAGVHQDSDRLAAGLASLGLGAGDRSCLMMQNSLECIDAWFAMNKAGVVEVPINQAYRGPPAGVPDQPIPLLGRGVRRRLPRPHRRGGPKPARP